MCSHVRVCVCVCVCVCVQRVEQLHADAVDVLDKISTTTVRVSF